MSEENDLKSFNTLRGFLQGYESDEPPYFKYSATLRIMGTPLNFDEITQQLGVEPTHTHRKGDKKGPRSSGFPHDMWAYKPSVFEENPLEEHIDTLWASIQHAENYLLDLKSKAKVDVFLSYVSNIDHAGIQVPHTCLEMFTRLEIPFGISIIIA